jgi:cob(I)alamin adenosyltransferase
MPKIYTKAGDDGSTGLYGAGRVGKSSRRIEAIGNIDETNAVIGWCRSEAEERPDFDQILGFVQTKLFELGGEIASPTGRYQAMGEEQVDEVEKVIDMLEASLPPLKNFVLPGGSEIGARLHIARTVCRRAERSVVALAQDEEVPPVAVKYLNRLSDLLFQLARTANRLCNVQDVAWLPERNS